MRNIKTFAKWYIKSLEQLIIQTLNRWEVQLLKLSVSDLHYQESEIWLI